MTPAELYRRAIANIESGGNYRALGPTTHGDRAYGKYQMMGANIGPWSEQALGRRLSPQEFLSNPQAQDAIFDSIFGGYAQKYGPEGAAQAWFGGPGSVGQTGRRDVLGTDVGKYGRMFMQGIGGNLRHVGGAGSGAGNFTVDAPVFGSMSPGGAQPSAIDNPPPGAGQWAFGEDQKGPGIGKRLAAAGQAIDDAVMPAARINYTGGDARQGMPDIMKLLATPNALAQALLQRRLS